MLYVDVCTKLGWKGLVTYLTKYIFIRDILNQIKWGFRRDVDN